MAKQKKQPTINKRQHNENLGKGNGKEKERKKIGK